MLFFAPEITTMLNPNKNPAQTNPTDQMKIRKFMDGLQKEMGLDVWLARWSRRQLTRAGQSCKNRFAF
jgi:hypothetical protein